MFIARQPIFNKALNVIGYELLFRSTDISNKYNAHSSVMATATVLEGLLEDGIDRITEGKFAFVNFDENFIYSDSLQLISPDKLVIEILENVHINDTLIQRLHDLKNGGYKIALDDFTKCCKDYPLFPICDIVKYDLIETPLDSIKYDVNYSLLNNKILVAEKVETREDFEKAKEMGFQLFQGFFFCKPSIIIKSSECIISNTQYIRIMQEINKEEPSYQTLAEIIEQDIHLSYRLMRVIKSRSGDDTVYSIKRALVYMGLKEIERWIIILMLQDIGTSKPKELIKVSLIRTKLAELIADHSNLKKVKHEASMMGLFSTLDAMLNKTMADALSDIPLTTPIMEALAEQKGVLFPIYELIIACEEGDWVKTNELTKEVQIDENILYTEYINAIEWSMEALSLIV